jgi:hypothetical protein
VTPEAAIEMLDRQLARNGSDVEMYRLVGTGPTATKQGLGVPVRAHVRTLNEDELTAGLTQDDHMVILSPTSFTAWPPGRPQKGDKVILEGLPCNVEVPRPIRINGTLVRLELKVKG